MNYYEGFVGTDEYGLGILGMGRHVPEEVIPNDYFRIARITPEKITRITGIRERRRCKDHESASDMAIEATRSALAEAGYGPDDLSMIIVATASPDHLTPPTANILQQRLGIDHIPCMDINSGGCANSVFGLITALQFLMNSPDSLILVVATETFKGRIDYEEKTSVYFGDGACAFVLGKTDPGKGFTAYNFKSIAKDMDALLVPGGGSRLPLNPRNMADGSRIQYLSMDGGKVLDFATRFFPESVERLLSFSSTDKKEVATLIAHQANINIIHNVMDKLGFDRSQTHTTIHKYGNTSGASLGITLVEALHEGKISKGDTVVVCGFGAGLAVGSLLIKF